MSQDSRGDDVTSGGGAAAYAPTVAEEESLSSAYEELLAAVVNAKEGQRSLSTVFKVLPPKEVCDLLRVPCCVILEIFWELSAVVVCFFFWLNKM